MPAPLTPEQSEKVVNLYASGLTLRQTAAQIGCHLETVRKHVKRAGVPVRGQWRHR